MGDIIEAEDTHLGRRVVIKRLQAGVEERRIIDEHKALAKLRAKHVVQLYDVIDVNDRDSPEIALVLEYIDGRDLAVNSLTIGDEYLKIIWQIACGLGDIHGAGVIHRDVKPNNIRIDREGVVKIIDFGLARSADEAKTRSVIGTPVFMAPELWGDSTVSFDSSIDVYAFGVTCAALVSKTPPHPLILNPPQLPARAEIDSVLKGLPAPLTDAVFSCLAQDPKSRPTIAAVAQLIERHLLKDRHRALVVLNGQPHWLHKGNRKISVKAGTVGQITIEYDGYDFRVTEVVGAVMLNNVAAQVRDVVPGCCVITFGTGGARQFVTFDISHPEVMA